MKTIIVIITVCFVITQSWGETNTPKAVKSPQAVYTLKKHTFSSGGGVVASGIYKVTSSIGQIDAEYKSTAGVYQFNGGFLQAHPVVTTPLIFANGFE